MDQLTYGDYILIEIALMMYLKDLDLTTQSGQYVSQLLGKIEYKLSQLGAAAAQHIPVPPPAPSKPNVKN